MPTRPTLLLFTGPPGTGKSSLAELAAEEMGAPVLGWDWAMAALTGFTSVQAAVDALPPADHRRVGWSILWNVATAQLRRGASVVLDGVARDAEVADTRRVAEAEGARPLVVTTCCRDRELHRARVAGRARDIPGWHELDWAPIERLLTRWQPPAAADLALDAADPWDDNVGALVALLRRPAG